MISTLICLLNNLLYSIYKINCETIQKTYFYNEWIGDYLCQYILISDPCKLRIYIERKLKYKWKIKFLLAF